MASECLAEKSFCRWVVEFYRRLDRYNTIQVKQYDPDFECSMSPTATSYVAFSEHPQDLCLETDIIAYNPYESFARANQSRTNPIVRQTPVGCVQQFVEDVVDEEFPYNPTESRPEEPEAKALRSSAYRSIRSKETLARDQTPEGVAPLNAHRKHRAHDGHGKSVPRKLPLLRCRSVNGKPLQGNGKPSVPLGNPVTLVDLDVVAPFELTSTSNQSRDTFQRILPSQQMAPTENLTGKCLTSSVATASSPPVNDFGSAVRLTHGGNSLSSMSYKKDTRFHTRITLATVRDTSSPLEPECQEEVAPLDSDTKSVIGKTKSKTIPGSPAIKRKRHEPKVTAPPTEKASSEKPKLSSPVTGKIESHHHVAAQQRRQAAEDPYKKLYTTTSKRREASRLQRNTPDVGGTSAIDQAVCQPQEHFQVFFNGHNRIRKDNFDGPSFAIPFPPRRLGDAAVPKQQPPDQTVLPTLEHERLSVAMLQPHCLRPRRPSLTKCNPVAVQSVVAAPAGGLSLGASKRPNAANACTSVVVKTACVLPKHVAISKKLASLCNKDKDNAQGHERSSCSVKGKPVKGKPGGASQAGMLAQVIANKSPATCKRKSVAAHSASKRAPKGGISKIALANKPKEGKNAPQVAAGRACVISYSTESLSVTRIRHLINRFQRLNPTIRIGDVRVLLYRLPPGLTIASNINLAELRLPKEPVLGRPSSARVRLGGGADVAVPASPAGPAGKFHSDPVEAAELLSKPSDLEEPAGRIC